MRHLISGGAGFIGSHLCDRLLDAGDEVVALDNLITGSRANIAHLSDNPRFLFKQFDVTRPIPISVRFDQVWHLASLASPRFYSMYPIETLESGSTATRNMLEIAKRDGARFLVTSTSETYGDPLVHPQPESYLGNVDPIGPRSCYDEAKRFSEAITMAYHRARGTDIRIARIFNTYGERMRPDDGRVVNAFIVAALRGEPLQLFGDGSQTRSFCHVSDEVRGLLAVLDGDLTGPVNVGNPGEFTVAELAAIVVELTGSTSPIVCAPLPFERTGDPNRRRPDISLISSSYGWTPTVGLREGLDRMIRSYRDDEGIG